jgi:DNA mismatch endonuclease (patch repair protein)
MSRVRGRDTRPELDLRRALWASRLRYRLQVRTPFGRPDLLFRRQRVAVFIDGCFWHGCPEHYVRPRERPAFWARKLRANVERDMAQTMAFEEAGWRVCRFWEHEVFLDLPGAVSAVLQAVGSADWKPVPRWCVAEVHALDPAGQTEERRLVNLRDTGTMRSVIQPRSTRKWRVTDRADHGAVFNGDKNH